MEKIEINNLTLICEPEAEAMSVTWLGKSRDMDPYEKLIPVLENVLEKTNSRLILKFNALEYINSSTVVPIIKFLKKADQKKINTEIHYNGQISWQKSMFKAIANLTKVFKFLTVSEENIGPG